MNKGQGHVNFKVKVTQYKGQMLQKKDFYILDCECFCDLCVTQMVRLSLKGILVLK